MGVCGVVRVRAVWVELPLHAAWHLSQPVRLRVVEEQRELGVVHLPSKRDSSFGTERCCNLLHKEYEPAHNKAQGRPLFLLAL